MCPGTFSVGISPAFGLRFRRVANGDVNTILWRDTQSPWSQCIVLTKIKIHGLIRTTPEVVVKVPVYEYRPVEIR